MSHFASYSWLNRLACGALFFFGAAAAHAQYEVGLKLNKESYVTYEGVEATVTVKNRSGSDVVLGGPNNTAWLSFDISDPQSRPVPPMRFRSDDVIVFKAGTTIARKVPLSEQYTFSDMG